VAAASAAREVADYARDIVGTASDTISTRERIHGARRLRLLALEVLDRSVIAEALSGASWAEIADALLLDEATARARYEEAVATWADPQSAEQRGPGEAGDPDVGGTAAGLDLWWERHRDAHDPRSGSRTDPVGGLLDRP
jgi:hypothetical protein